MGDQVVRHGTDESLLANRRCRYLLYCLYMYTTPMRLLGIADQLTVWELDDGDDDYLDHRLRLYTDLYHDHLPGLRNADLVTYEQTDDVVTLEPAAEEYRPLVERRFRSEVVEFIEAERATSPRAQNQSGVRRVTAERMRWSELNRSVRT